MVIERISLADQDQVWDKVTKASPRSDCICWSAIESSQPLETHLLWFLCAALSDLSSAGITGRKCYRQLNRFCVIVNKRRNRRWWYLLYIYYKIIWVPSRYWKIEIEFEVESISGSLEENSAPWHQAGEFYRGAWITRFMTYFVFVFERCHIQGGRSAEADRLWSCKETFRRGGHTQVCWLTSDGGETSLGMD